MLVAIPRSRYKGDEEVPMTDDVDNHTLAYLRRMDAKLDRLIVDVTDIKARLQSVETGFVDLRRDVVSLHADMVRIDHRLDAIDTRVARIERRLDLRDNVPA